MAMPLTRPITRNATQFTQGALPRPAEATSLALPPSNGTRLPRGQGTLHTVKNPAHKVPAPTVHAAAVT